MTLRARLALMFGLVGVVASALVGLLSFRATEGELDSTTDTFLSTRAEELGRGTRGPPDGQRRQQRGTGTDGDGVRSAFEADALVQAITRDGEKRSTGTELPITDDAKAMAELAPGELDRSNLRFDDIEVDGTRYRMASLALPEGGAIQVARATDESDGVTSALVVRFGVIAAIVGILGALIGLVIARQTTRPLRRLADAASDVAATRDLTIDVGVESSDEIGQLADSFRAMLVALQESREQQHRLVHDAGHELRTPLTSLRANVALLERFENMELADRREIVAAVNSELHELSDLFSELIDLATDEGAEEVAFERLDLDGVIRTVVDRWHRRTARPIDVDSAKAIVSADPSMLDRAVNNLISNADKFSPPGEPISIVASGGRVAVRDRGPGVAPADRTRIFDRFYRTEATRDMPGSGLGLAIVARIVEVHGGSVFVTDAPDGGAEIGFTLPAAD